MDATAASHRQSSGQDDVWQAPYLREEQRDWLLARIREKPDLTLHALLEELAAERDVVVSCDTLWRLRRRAGIGLKRALHASKQNRSDVARPRRWWRRIKPSLPVERLALLDETWTRTSITRLRGWWRRGEPLLATTPHGHWRTTTVLAALRHDGITAPFVIDGPINGASFLAHVEQILVPTPRPEGIVVIGNLGSHKGYALRKAINAAGARLRGLPPSSPELSAIEQVFAKLKTMQRKAAERTVEAVWTRIGALPTSVLSTECANDLWSSGYGSTSVGKALRY